MSPQALYMPHTTGGTPRARRNLIKALITTILSALFLVTGSSLDTLTTAAHADGDADSKKKLEEAQKNFGVTEGDTGFSQALEKAKGDKDRNSFGYVINRVITPRYLGDTPQSAIDGQYKGDKVHNCRWDDPKNGTLIYHNCDIPNITAEFYQKLYDTFIPSGIIHGTTESATIDNKWFGLPTEVPNNTVPADPGARQGKYTGLELYGYSLGYTVYAGEYDSIRVDTQARMMANFGLSESFALGTQTIIQGVAGGLERAGQRTSEEWKKGNYVGALFAGIGGFFEGAASSSVNTILDTSDANVFATRGWARTTFGRTVYGARELSQREKEEELLKLFASLFKEQFPESEIPEDLKKIKNPPEKPGDGTPTCSWKDGDGDHKEKGVNEDDCRNHENSTWDAGKKETLKEWKDKNREFFDTAAKYNLGCLVGTDESKRDDIIAGFYACYPDAIKTLMDKEAKTADNSAIQNYLKQVLAQSFIQQKIKDNKAFNNPAFAYVCVDDKGNDMMDGDRHVYVFNEDGTYTGRCGTVRSPIQNGVYGNGYSNSVPKDTRREIFDPSVSRVLFDTPVVVNSYANLSLTITGLITRVSNTFLNLSYSPILKTFGADKIIVTILVAFRDSLFFPLAGIIVFSVIGYYMIAAIKTGGARRAIMMMFASILITLFGAIIFARPQQVVDFVDYAPSIIASDLTATIVGNGTDDKLCQADGDTDFTMVATKGDGDVTGVARGNRMLMCENWRLGYYNYWVFGQWGTHPKNLYANGKEAPDGATLTNSNTALVGDATVNMGAGVTVNNWALYQADVMSAGTTMEKDTRGIGEVSRNMYRIVDAQAGIKNGEGTDPRFFQNWSNHSWGNRVFVALTAPFGSVVLAVAVILYTTRKIVVTVITMFYLAIGPLVFVLAPIGARGHFTLKNWGMTLLGLMFQMVALIVLLALMMLLIVTIGNSTNSYLGALFSTGITAGIFIMYRKKILRFVMVGSGFGGSLQASDVSKYANQYAPATLKNAGARLNTGYQGARAGFIAGVKQSGLKGGFQGAASGVRMARNTKTFKSNIGAVRTWRAATSTGRSVAAKQQAERAAGVNMEALRKDMATVATHHQSLTTGDTTSNKPVPPVNASTPHGARVMRDATRLAADREKKIAAIENEYRAEHPEDTADATITTPTFETVRADLTRKDEREEQLRVKKEAVNNDYFTKLSRILDEHGRLHKDYRGLTITSGEDTTGEGDTTETTSDDGQETQAEEREYTLKNLTSILGMTVDELEDMLGALEEEDPPNEPLIREVRRVLTMKKERLQ